MNMYIKLDGALLLSTSFYEEFHGLRYVDRSKISIPEVRL
jgi:hypothetical protein